VGKGLWCPVCGDEFRSGFSMCPDCHIALVDEPKRRHPGADDRGRLLYDLSDWDEEQRKDLAFVLTVKDIPAAWDGAALVVPERYRGYVDEAVDDLTDSPFAMELVEDEPSTSDVALAPDGGPGGEQFDVRGSYRLDETGPWATFSRDVATSLRAWRVTPGLPLATLALAIATSALGAASVREPFFVIPTLALWLFAIGFAGTQRIWYLRAFHQESLPVGDIVPLTAKFFWRFARLGLLFALPGSVVIAVAGVLGGTTGRIAACVAWSIAMDMALTFVTPALSYTTRFVRDAVPTGFRTVTRSWPTSACYVLTPGFVTAAAVWVLPESVLGATTGIAIGTVGAMLALVFKGAIAAFYLRRHGEPCVFGAAYDDQWATQDTLAP
jgi:hypothetical protein